MRLSGYSGHYLGSGKDSTFNTQMNKYSALMLHLTHITLTVFVISHYKQVCVIAIVIFNTFVKILITS